MQFINADITLYTIQIALKPKRKYFWKQSISSSDCSYKQPIVNSNCDQQITSTNLQIQKCYLCMTAVIRYSPFIIGPSAGKGDPTLFVISVVPDHPEHSRSLIRDYAAHYSAAK